MSLKFDATYLLRTIPEQASEVLLQAGNDVFEISQQFVAVDKGLLKKSGGVVQESSTKVIVGYGGEGSQREGVAAFIEYGTVNSAAQPFLTPSFAQAQSIIEARAKEKIGR